MDPRHFQRLTHRMVHGVLLSRLPPEVAALRTAQVGEKLLAMVKGFKGVERLGPQLIARARHEADALATTWTPAGPRPEPDSAHASAFRVFAAMKSFSIWQRELLSWRLVCLVLPDTIASWLQMDVAAVNIELDEAFTHLCLDLTIPWRPADGSYLRTLTGDSFGVKQLEDALLVLRVEPGDEATHYASDVVPDDPAHAHAPLPFGMGEQIARTHGGTPDTSRTVQGLQPVRPEDDITGPIRVPERVPPAHEKTKMAVLEPAVNVPKPESSDSVAAAQIASLEPFVPNFGPARHDVTVQNLEPVRAAEPLNVDALKLRPALGDGDEQPTAAMPEITPVMAPRAPLAETTPRLSPSAGSPDVTPIRLQRPDSVEAPTSPAPLPLALRRIDPDVTMPMPAPGTAWREPGVVTVSRPKGWDGQIAPRELRVVPAGQLHRGWRPFAIAAVCAAVSAVAGWAVVNGSVWKREALKPVIVLRSPLEAGTRLYPEMLAEREVPAALVTPSVVIPELVALVHLQRLRTDVAAGEPLRWSQLDRPETMPRLAAEVRPEARAYALEVESDSAVGYHVTAGDRVDIVAVLGNGSVDSTQAFLAAEDVPVLATGKATARYEPTVGKTSEYLDLSLLVLPEDAERLALVREKGKYVFTLRNRQDHLSAGDVRLGSKELLDQRLRHQ